MLVGDGAGDLEPGGQGRTRRAMRVLLPCGANDFKQAVTQAGGDAILELLKKYKTIAVVGLSSNPMRPSFGVTEYMQGAAYRIIPVNPNETEVLGEKSYARLEDVPESQHIEIVDIFRRSEHIPPVVDSAIAVGAKVIWTQQGIENQKAAAKAHAAGLFE